MNTKEAVNHPPHYLGKDPTFETIKVLKAWLTPEQYEGFLLGNSLKYQSRYKLKNGQVDLEKAQWYQNELVKEYQNGYFQNQKVN